MNARPTPGSILLIGMLFLAATNGFGADEHWVATWGCAPQLVEPRNLPPAPGLGSNTLRQIVHVSVGGKRLRARFSNLAGDGPLTIAAAHFALAVGGSAIQAETDTALSFDKSTSVMIRPGEAIWSDPFDFDLAPLTSVAVTIRFSAVPTAITGHPGSRATSYLQPGDEIAAPAMPDAVKTQHWYVLTGIDTATEKSSAAVVVLGDSITDGRGSTTDGNDRWPDDLARRFRTNGTTAHVAVVNEGIGGNTVLAGGLGPTATARFDRDMLGQSGAGWFVVFEGVNDIGGSHGPDVADRLIGAYQSFIDKARAKGLRIYGATITPFGRSMYSSPAHETARQAVNKWIRTGSQFDGVIDFDAVTRDQGEPANLLPAYDTGDHLHLNPAGYQAMADAVELVLFGPSRLSRTSNN
jgi:lysophospholipase L1-like esterase